jgi:hypothetical protein
VFDPTRQLLLKLRLNAAEREALIKIAIVRGVTPSDVLRDYIGKNAPR